MKAHYPVAFLLMLLVHSSNPCRGADFVLKDGETMVFLGDSITAARGYTKVVEHYTLMRFPQRQVRFINAGQGGDTASAAVGRLERDVFAKGATAVTVAFGVNDIGWGMKATPENKQKYLDGIRAIVTECRQKGVRPYICSPAITAEAPDPAERGFLQTMTDEGLSLAQSLGAETIDLQRGMRTIQRRVLAANGNEPDKTRHALLHAPDGVHLTDLGQLAMGYVLLKGLGAPAEVSSSAIDATTTTLSSGSGCTVSGIRRQESGGISFTRLDEGLPMNLGIFSGLQHRYVPLPEGINRYMLTVTGLAEGKYEVLADGRKIGQETSASLTKGINLSSMTADPWEPGGPWNAQSNSVKEMVDARDKLWAGGVMRERYLGAQPDAAAIAAETKALDALLTELMRRTAQPFPYEMEIRPAQAEATAPPPPDIRAIDPPDPDRSTAMERVRPSNDGTHFIRGGARERFTVWGFNYDRDDAGRLLEDYWENEWSAVVQDFHEMKELGANTVRIHLQLARFMKSREDPDAANLARLKKLLTLAGKTGLYLDITGLGCYHKADVPAWYEALDESARWKTQARFWQAVANVCKDSPAVFCYDLMNEPLGTGGGGQTDWLPGEPLGGKHFTQRISINPAGREDQEIARQWIKTLTDAIRTVDSQTMVTVGVIPWAQVFKGAKPLFHSPEAGRPLDFVSVHFYPRDGKLEEDLEALQAYETGKPLVIEEIFPLSASIEATELFMRKSSNNADGWLTFYWGKTIGENEKKGDMAGSLTGGWLRRFQALAPAFPGGGPK